METDTVVIQRITSSVMEAFKQNYICKQSDRIAVLEEQQQQGREARSELQAAMVKMAAAITQNAQDIAVANVNSEVVKLKLEKKMIALIAAISAAGGAGGGVVAQVLKGMIGG